MDQLFGDATTAMPTPATQAEHDSLMGFGSPIPSLDIRRGPGQFSADAAIPGLDIDPPHISAENGKSTDGPSRASEGVGGWISKMINRSKGQGKGNEEYRRLEQQDEE
jgi:hypothetical protein